MAARGRAPGRAAVSGLRRRDTRIVFVSEVGGGGGKKPVSFYGVVRKDGGEGGLLYGPARWREVQAWRRELPR